MVVTAPLRHTKPHPDAGSERRIGRPPGRVAHRLTACGDGRGTASGARHAAGMPDARYRVSTPVPGT